MRIIVEEPEKGQEEEIIIRTGRLDDQLLALISSIRTSREKLSGFQPDGSIQLLEPQEVYYFEAVDNRVFAYCEKEVYEVHKKLYELEEQFDNTDFFRCSKSVILNLSKVYKLTPVLGGRFEVLLNNNEKSTISRQYVPLLKKKLEM